MLSCYARLLFVKLPRIGTMQTSFLATEECNIVYYILLRLFIVKLPRISTFQASFLYYYVIYVAKTIFIKLPRIS